MRYLFKMGTALFMSQFLASQTLNDINYLTSSDLSGSARYTGMAGAFGALGGDLTAICDNPAASSVFLNTEIGASINFQSRHNKGSYFGSLQTSEDENSYFDQFGAVFVFNNKDSENPWSRISAGLNINRVATFDQNAGLNGINSSGIADYFLYYADGVPFGDIQLYDDKNIEDVYRYLGDEVGYGFQQAFLGYQAYIIDPYSFDVTERAYFSNVDSSQVRHDLDLSNRGFHRKTSFNFSTLYQNLLHVGVNINSHKIEFINDQELFEGDHDLDSYVYDINFNNYLISFGEGFSMQFGAILKLKNLRLGASYDSPQWIDIQDETKQNLSAYRFEDGSEIQEIIDPAEITNSFAPYRLKIPSKINLSLAYIFNESGLISFDYSSQDLSNSSLSQSGGSNFLDNLTSEVSTNFNAVNTIKVGGEYRIKNLSLRGGYFYRTKNQSLVSNDDQAFTFGIGLNFYGSNLNLSFVQFDQNKRFQLFSEGLTDSYELSKSLSQITLSYNFKL